MTARSRTPTERTDDFFNESGAGLNRTRPKSPMDSARRVSNRSSTVHIDLYNFEDSRYEGSKYVLTSPRSLEACSRLNVKPVELLHKSMAEVQEELMPEGFPLSEIYTRYDQQEAARLETLRLAREERARIIREEAKKDRSHLKPQVYGVKGGQKSRSGDEQDEKKDHEKPFDELVRGSLERKRTALVTKQTRRTISPDRLTRPRLKSDSPPTKVSTRPRPKSAGHGGTNKPKSSTISAKDRKIVELMAARQREEAEFYRERERARVSWTDSRTRESEVREQAESKRRQKLAHTDTDFSVSGKQLKDKSRKMRQEQNLAANERDRQEMEELMKKRQEVDIAAAGERKQQLTTSESQTKAAENSRQDRKRLARLHELQLDKQQNIVDLHEAIELKQRRATSVQIKQQQRRDDQLQQQHSKRERKQQRAHSARQELDAAIDKYQRDLLHYSQQREDDAERNAEQRRSRSVQKTAERRHAKRSRQLNNKQKIDQDEEDMKREMRRYLADKQDKADAVINERDHRAQQSRARAASAERLRWSIREQYGADSFDKMALRAELSNKIGGGPCSSMRNQSSLRIS